MLNSLPYTSQGRAFPHTASLNNVFVEPDQNDSAYFSMAYVRNNYSDKALRQAKLRYPFSSFVTGWPRQYVFGGDDPNSSAAPIRQPEDLAVLYEMDYGYSDGPLRTSRQFFGFKQKPTGYMAHGREVNVRMNLSDSLQCGISIMMHDPWYSNTEGGYPVEMIPRTNEPLRIDSLEQVNELFRTKMFTTFDSTLFGLQLEGRFYGDETEAGDAAVIAVAELINATTDEVVYQLDSFVVSGTTDTYSALLEQDYDLLSGEYYIRVRLETESYTPIDIAYDSRFPVGEVMNEVEETPASKRVIRTGTTGGTVARVSAQPNPFTEMTEIRFSVPHDSRVSVRVYDMTGRLIAEPVPEDWMDQGRYAVPFDGGDNLPEGVYMVELRVGTDRMMEKMIYAR